MSCDLEWGLYGVDRDGDSYKVRPGDSEVPSICLTINSGGTIALSEEQLDELYEKAKELF
jgi:hypothetical protein